MRRMVAPDRGVRETVVGNTTYQPSKNGIYAVESSKHADAMKREGFFEASLNPISKDDGQKGYCCVECGFNGWFRKCGRCGHESTAIQKDGD